MEDLLLSVKREKFIVVFTGLAVKSNSANSHFFILKKYRYIQWLYNEVYSCNLEG